MVSKPLGVSLAGLPPKGSKRCVNSDPNQGASPQRMHTPRLTTLRSDVKSWVAMKRPNTIPSAPQLPHITTISKDAPQGKDNQPKPLPTGAMPNSSA